MIFYHTLVKIENEHKTVHQAGCYRNIVMLLCLTAACRIFFFNAAFPLFNNVDEETHFDLVYKYSKGYLPKAGVEDYNRTAVEFILLYGTPEYLLKPEQFPEKTLPPPLWTHPNVCESEQFAETVNMLHNKHKNYESGSLPLYYIVAGIWYNAGIMLGMSDGQLLYWIRFLNVPIFMALVWFSYRAAQVCFPEGVLQQIAVPLILTFFPQDVFYSINVDTISPLSFAISFLMLLQIYFENKSYCYYLSAGLMAAATLLTRMPNAAMPALLFAIVILKIKKLRNEQKVRKYLPRLGVLLAAAVIPVGIWLIRNYIVLGNLTGTADKMKFWGWTVKPLSKLLDHPIFTVNGLSYFLAELTRTFWRGEFVWHLERVAWWGTDLFYVVSSAVFMAACGIGIIISRHRTKRKYRFVLIMSFLVVGVSVLLLAVSSLLYDFNGCWAPSREKPYFTAGRLISSVLLPFLLIYTDGLERVFHRLGKRVTLLVIIIIVIGITLSEIWLTREILNSPYNWFGLI